MFVDCLRFSKETVTSGLSELETIHMLCKCRSLAAQFLGGLLYHILLLYHHLVVK